MQRNVVVIFIFIKDSKILIEKRSLVDFEEEQYLIPGGTVKEGEEVVTALKREVLEELGIIPISFYPLSTKKDILGLANQLLLPFFITEWAGEFPTTILDKGTPLFWVDFDEALTSKVKPTREIIIALKNHLL